MAYSSQPNPTLNGGPDNEDHDQKDKEKPQIVSLNDKFVARINKVRQLEEENKKLKTKLKILLDQVDSLAQKQRRLQLDLNRSQEELRQQRMKYEDEIQKKAELENEFVVCKKDLDEGYLKKTSLEQKVAELTEEMDFLNRGFQEEIKELQSKIQNATVVLEPDNNRSLDLQSIVQDIKTQYEDMVARSRVEAEQWYKKKLNDMATTAQINDEDMQNLKKEISDIVRLIQKLNSDLDSLKKKRDNLNAAIEGAKHRGQQAHEEALQQITNLQDALSQAKRDLVRHVREYQDLMNIKLALDIEIATYKKLLDGEEFRQHRPMNHF
ncbi:keratin, type II cytoskeletal 8-like isoform X2 [Brienomyrus brachyistius]|uniref:keratin, type II cytoskeletal 8-like isoform X2 n=1 Tax=Brienomyrus brachyistius TaxID=42636 RepID=UPI0020B42580|nr:keratin, type II cytoskeletal 8-like isoform X2 [Brienomyrus brachyistius]